MSLRNLRNGKIGPPPSAWDTEYVWRIVRELEMRDVWVPEPAQSPMYLATSGRGFRYGLGGNIDGLDISDSGVYDGQILTIGYDALATGGVDHRSATSPDGSIAVAVTATELQFTLGTGSTMDSWEGLGQVLDPTLDLLTLYDGSEGQNYSLQVGTLGAWAVQTYAYYQTVVYNDTGGGGSALTQRNSLNFLPGLLPTDNGGTGRTDIALDIPGLTAETASASGDLVALYDASATAHRKMTLGNLIGGIGAVGGRGSGIADRVAYWTDVNTLTASDSLRFPGNTFELRTVSPIFRTYDTDTTGAAAAGHFEFYDAALTRLGLVGFSSGANYVLNIINQQAGDLDLYTSNTRRINILSTGNVGIGQPAGAGTRLALTYTPTDASISQNGQTITLTPTFSSGGPNNNNGFNVLCSYAGSVSVTEVYGAVQEGRGAHSAGTITRVAGVRGLGRSTTGGAITDLWGHNAIIVTGAGSTAAIASANAIEVSAPSLSGTPAITAMRGVHVGNQGHSTVTTSYAWHSENQSGGATKSWQLVVGTGDSAFADNVMIGAAATAPSAKLEVRQASLGTAVVKRSSTATNDDPSLTEQHGRVTTTNNTTTTLTGCTQTLTADKAYRVKAKVVARRTGGSAGSANDVGAWEFEGVFVNTAGTAAQQGATAALFGDGNLATAGMTATFDCNSADVRVRVTGATNYNVTWHGILEFSEVGT